MIPEIDQQWVGKLLRTSAERFVLPRFHAVSASRKPDGSIVTSADIDSQNFLQDMLAARYPDIPLLGEEMSATEQTRLLHEADALWCLDPLDGSSNFAAGVPIFGISLALLQGGHSVLGWVYDPVRAELFSAAKGSGARVDGVRMAVRQAPALGQCVGVVDYKRLDRALALRLIDERPFHSQRNFGASVLEWCWLAAGRYHFYLHGAQQLWDRAAGALILHEAGGRATQFNGGRLSENDLQTRSVLATLDPRLHQSWSRWLEAVGETPAQFPNAAL
ncbi:MAG: inositol monophosphatase family protein [Acidithiobacillus sp.]|jgi:myo-inositol-1(or 4)-monophosphatase|uniref:Inositol monophosphatase family protein n=1 Tax=Acidithiobacillus ferruginosus TaxID=3063951 RepID=A0ACD5IGU0_9PROT|nr:inositol monophosphatase family protein [Acidithiobacillus ferruginosus]MBU2813859.1 inositol monophosphatase family protein [Acidithiobacillus ferruginosus]MDD5575397.1 inositol monophosphatase family protein [Acidithiobacillus sp.]